MPRRQSFCAGYIPAAKTRRFPSRCSPWQNPTRGLSRRKAYPCTPITRKLRKRWQPALVPCHNDPLCENWVQGADKLYLLDWEYAGMNDPMWDLADVSIEAGYTQTQDNQLLESYLQRKPTGEEQRRFLANKIYVDYLWTLWAKTRVPYDGQPMEDWAAERYARLKGFLGEFGRLEAAVCR